MTTTVAADGPRIAPAARADAAPGVLRMSAAGYCPRRRFYEFTGVQPTSELTARRRRTLALGQALEESVVGWIEAQGATVLHRQLELRGEYSRGHIDGVTNLDGGWKPFDVKTAAQGFVGRTAQGGFAGWAHQLGLVARQIEDLAVVAWPHEAGGVRVAQPGYYAQAQMYMHHGREQQLAVPVDWDRFLFVVLDKSEQRLLIEEIGYVPEHAEALLRREAALHERASAGGPPPPIPRGYAAGRFPCSWAQGRDGCRYRGLCWGAAAPPQGSNGAAAGEEIS